MSEQRTYAGFIPQFWLINFIELLERGAFYGALSFIGLYLNALEYQGAILGLLLGLALSGPYLISVASGPFAEKFGYRPMVVFSFIGYALGYTLIALLDSLPGTATLWIALGLIMVAMGSGLFKAIPAACITHLAPEEKRNQGMVIYYAMINVGALTAPLLIGFLILGTDATIADYRMAYLSVAAISLAALVMAFTLFRNPVEPSRDMSLAQTFKPLAGVLMDRRFTIGALFYVGFFVVYAMNFSFMVIYLDQYVALPSWFPASIQQSLNPLVIVIAAPLLGGLPNKFNPLRLMTVGLALFLGGFLVLGFSGSFWGWAIGITIAAVGEMLTQPGWLSYVGRIAPKHQVAVYQSMGFAPIFLGFLIGPVLGGILWENIAVDSGHVPLFWAIVTSAAFIPLAGFLILAAKQRESEGGRTVTKREKTLAGVPILAIVAVILVGFLVGPVTALDKDADEIGSIDPDLGSWSESLEEGSSWSQELAIPASGTVTLGLSWTDEEASAGDLGLIPVDNAPDRFRVTILDGDTELATQEDDDGNLVLEWANDAGARTVTIEVFLIEAGDHTASGQPVGEDTGNDWELEAGFATA